MVFGLYIKVRKAVVAVGKSVTSVSEMRATPIKKRTLDNCSDPNEMKCYVKAIRFGTHHAISEMFCIQ